MLHLILYPPPEDVEEEELDNWGRILLTNLGEDHIISSALARVEGTDSQMREVYHVRLVRIDKDLNLYDRYVKMST